MKTKKIVSVLLVMLLLTGCLTACGNSQSANKPGNNLTTASKYTYKATYYPLKTSQGVSPEWISSYCLCEDKLVFHAAYVDGMTTAVNELTGEPIIDEQTGKPIEYENHVYGAFIYDMTTQTTTGLTNYTPMEIPEGMLGESNINKVIAGANDTFWVFEELYTYSYDLPENFNQETDNLYSYYQEGERRQRLTQFSANGDKITSVELENEEAAYYDSLYVLTDGRILGYDWTNIYLFDATGKKTDTIACENSGPLSQIGPDRFVISVYADETSSMVLKVFDIQSKSFAEELPLDNLANQVYEGPAEYDYVYQANDSVFGVPTGKTEGEKLFSWLECDVNSNNINQFIFREDGTILAIEETYASDEVTTNLLIMEQVDPATLPEKQELVLGCMGLDWETRNAIISFNHNHDDVRIQVRDYSEYIDGTGDNYESAYKLAMQRLNTEILSGSAPDILCTSELPIRQYAARGILLDLWPLIDSDPELSRDDLMTHFFETISLDGKLYEVTDSFSIQTAVTSAQIADGRTSWTLDELLEALNSLPAGATIFGETDISEYILQTVVSFNLDSFVDWKTNTCSFDSPEFVDLLEFAGKFPKEFNYEDYDWDSAESDYVRLKSGKQLMSACYISSFDSVQMYSAMFDGQPAFIGYPTSTGSGSTFNYYGGMAITAGCKAPDAAWQLVRELLLEKNQVEEYMYNFPTNRKAFDTYVSKKMAPKDETNRTEVAVAYVDGDFSYGNEPLTQAEVDMFMAVYEQCNTVYSSNTVIMSLISDHTEAFFDGKKSAEETARLIQDNVGLYLMEQG